MDSSPQQNQSGTILIVDQDGDLAALLSAALAAYGLRAQYTTRAREAIRRCGNQKFTHIFIDTHLAPDDAVKLVGEISTSSFNAKTPVTLMSSALDDSIPLTLAKRLHAILPKPFALETFLFRLNQAHEKKAAA